MISRFHSFVLRGIDAVACEVEADLNPAQMPHAHIVGLPDRAVKEAIQRVRAAILNSGFRLPRSRVVINLAPATIPKEGNIYDLPIALAILQAGRVIEGGEADGRPCPDDFLVAGELALDGRVRPINGVISLASLAKKQARRGVIVPASNAGEAAVVDGVEVLGVESLAEVVGFLNGQATIEAHPWIDIEALIAQAAPAVDFGDVRGQEAAKRALTVAAAGAHNVLLIGPAGSGKTMMAKALPGVLPPLTREEAVDVTRIYSSVGGLSNGEPLKTQRPVRAPHHSASAASIIGGGTVPHPGEVSLAHRGVLFLDEMPEFARNVLETLRQPLEDGWVTVTRTHSTLRFPARFMLVGAMNPTPKGNVAADEVSQREMQQYLSKLSGPLIDRIDLHVEVPGVDYKLLSGNRSGTDTATIRQRVMETRRFQEDRRGQRCANAELTGRGLDQCVALDDAASLVLRGAMTELGLSARAYDKIRRVSRTIADLEGLEKVDAHHVAEAVQYRLLDRLL